MVSREKIGPSNIGYAAIEAKDLFSDILHNNKNFDARQIVNHVIPRASKNTPNIPIFKYLKQLGINSEAECRSQNIDCEKIISRTLNDFRSRTYAKAFLKKYKEKNIQQIIDECTPENASAYIPFLPKENIHLDALKSFLMANEEKLDYQKSSYASSYRKLLTLYDRLAFGW